jgi:hypothetical protein
MEVVGDAGLGEPGLLGQDGALDQFVAVALLGVRK